jgi:signal transduction histidine kinase
METELAEVEGKLTPEAELALYRIVQEALSNVARHSPTGPGPRPASRAVPAP